MSTLNVNKIADASGGVLAPISSVMRNRIINGAMVIDQRNAGASVTPTANQYLVDRWQAATNVTSKFSVQQSTTAPTGFNYSMLATSLSAYSIGAAELCALRQSIEGYNVADLGWGTANAKTITISFWVRSSLTGTFGGSLMNGGADYSYPFTYTISASNTWEQKSVTVAGPTAGTWLTTNGIGLSILFGLGVGSTFSGTAGAWSGSTFYGATGATSVVGTNGATFYITGVQLEVGTQATSFEYRQYGTELALCQRYAYRFVGTGVQTTLVGSGGFFQSAQAECTVYFPVTMRTAPTSTIANGTNYWRNVTNGTTNNFNTLVSSLETPVGSLLYSTGASGTQGYSTRIDVLSSSAGILFTAEL
jgi:hypothetical protein